MSQHRWEEFVEPKEFVKLLREVGKRLKTVWAWDQKDPTNYPMNTSFALAEIEDSLSTRPRDENKTVRWPKWKAPSSLAELIPEKLIKSIWEEQHSGSFRDALRQASVVDFKAQQKSWKVFQGIIRAMERAYIVNFLGFELLPKPKVSILHRGLAQIAKAAGLEGQTEEGFAEFLDDLCPCGLRSHREAVRKLRSRSARNRRPKV